ncbi:transcriptional regulator [Mycolicibacterium obuense]|uniref:Transcriptional regulator n=1 Tax=Mycolicibacterium obuense TaxID=1807 RepID=A0A4R5X5I8_9MYCO|nr:helix-turn-helix domain-containing protein [Mycolicibacterium obuense]TDL07499.1 transcriptional regulator [Mycolicibacterium obuense]
MATTALRGLLVLEILAGMSQPASLRDIAARAGMSQSYTFRLLRALEVEGFLHHLGRSGYRLGSRSVALAAVIGPRPALLRLLFPAVARLATSSGLAVVVHLRAGASRVLILGVPAPSGAIVDPAGALGERSPLARGASGRVILAHTPEAESSQIAVDHDVRATFPAIRERGYEMSFGENHPGINGISAPLLAHRDDEALPPTAVGSLTVAGPAAELTAEKMTRIAPELIRTSSALGPRVAASLGPNPGATVAAHDL